MTTSERARSSATVMKRIISGRPKQEWACSTPASRLRTCNTSFVRPALTLMRIQAFVAIVPSLLQLLSPARHFPPSLRKHLVYVLTPLSESPACLFRESHQPIEVRRADVELAKARRQTISLIDCHGHPLFTERFKHIRCPTRRTEPSQGFICVASFLRSQSLSEK